MVTGAGDATLLVELGDVLDGLHEGVQVLSPSWTYLYVNAAVADHGRTTRDQLIGRTMMACYPGIEHTEMFARLARCQAARESASFENEFVYPDGARAWFELRVRPFRDGLLVLSLDVTQRKQVEGSMRQSYKLRALGELASGVAHDLANLLNPIQGHLELVRRKVTGDPDVAARVERILEMLHRGRQTVARLRDYARPEPSRPTPSVALAVIAREAADLCRARLGSHAAGLVPGSIEEELDPTVPDVAVDGADLLSALVNLISNAIEAHTGVAQVVVRTGATKCAAWIEVSDAGQGMAPEVRKRALEPFFSTKGDVGTGLGLPMAHACAMRHGGTITIESEQGKGTTVRLSFPLDGSTHGVSEGRASVPVP
jgi:PAS domain S-box-containing protein